MKSDLLKSGNSRLSTLRSIWTQGMLFLTVFGVINSPLFAADNNSSKDLKQSINNQSLQIKTHESDLRQLERNQKSCNEKINKLDREMNVIEKKTAVLSTEADQLNDERDELISELKKEESNLSELIKKTFMLGRNSSIKLFLNNEDPSINDRYLTYTKYLAEERHELIKEITKRREALKNKDAELTLKRQELLGLKTNYAELKKELLAEKIKQNSFATELKNTLNGERRQLQETTLALQKLENEIVRKQKELAAKRKLEAEKLAALRKQERERAKKENNSTPKHQAYSSVPAQGLQRQHGRLPWPVKGSVIHSFGDKRSGEVTWKGLVIAAPSGRIINAIADGDCIYSGWLNGLGNIVVIDHGRGYLSLYGNNKSISIASGDPVKSGQQIAILGNSGNFKTNSLYFEIRYEGIPVDPKRWLARH